MKTSLAFLRGQANRGKEMMVFDWIKAAQIIKELQPQEASAGLEEDWEYTGGRIFVDGKPYTDGYTYLASTWGTPQLLINGKVFDCYVMESEAGGWDAYTQWPRIALDILYSKNKGMRK